MLSENYFRDAEANPQNSESCIRCIDILLHSIRACFWLLENILVAITSRYSLPVIANVLNLLLIQIASYTGINCQNSILKSYDLIAVWNWINCFINTHDLYWKLETKWRERFWNHVFANLHHCGTVLYWEHYKNWFHYPILEISVMRLLRQIIGREDENLCFNWYCQPSSSCSQFI